jgi:hypothetical protein
VAQVLFSWLWRGLLLLAGVLLFLGGLLYLGHLALDHLRQEDAYQVRFTSIDCQPPPGMSRVDFLDEVQYLAELPATLPALDEDLPRRLAEAFACHPWVEKVEQVQIDAPNRARIKLHYRRAVLAVRWNNQLRAVDSNGILLPATASTQGLPIFPGKAQPPRGPAGTLWDDPAVMAAARKSKVHSP